MTQLLDAAVREYFRSNDRDVEHTLEAVLGSLRLEGADVRHTKANPHTGDVIMSVKGGAPHRWVPRGVYTDAWVPVDDGNHDRVMRAHHRAWGRRNLDTVRKNFGPCDVGRVNPTAIYAGPVIRQERYVPTKRAAGRWTSTPPYYANYSYYTKYGNAGRCSATAHVHNFPNGDVPLL